MSEILKFVVSSALSAPDVKAAISSLAPGEARDKLIKTLVKEQLTEAILKNPDIVKHITMENFCDKYINHSLNHSKVSTTAIQALPGCSSVTQSEQIDSDTDNHEDLSLLGTYIKELFAKSDVAASLD